MSKDILVNCLIELPTPDHRIESKLQSTYDSYPSNMYGESPIKYIEEQVFSTSKGTEEYWTQRRDPLKNR